VQPFLTAGSLDPSGLLRGIAASGLAQSAHGLVDAPIARVEAATLALSAACGETAGDDRTLVLVSADPRRRFESGIESRG
jgi:predicted carbohydrate-binding protein with CBM5 and CBM33 domain